MEFNESDSSNQKVDSLDSHPTIKSNRESLWHTVFEIIARWLGLSPQIAWDSVWSFVLKATNTGLTFLYGVLLARLLGANGYGVFAYVLALVTLLSIPAQSGLPNLVMRETARGMGQGHPELVQGIWRWSGKFVVVFSLVLVLLAGPLLLLWQGGVNSLQGTTLVWALALVPLIALGNLRGAALQGLQKIVVGQLPEFLIEPGLFVLLLGIAGLLSHGGLSAPLAMALQVLAALVAFLAGAWMLWRNTPRSVRRAQPLSEGWSWMASSFLFALIAGFGVLSRQTSTVILGIFVPPTQVGVYRVAVQVASLTSFGLMAINTVVAPRFAHLYAQGKMDRLQRLATGSARVVLAVSLALSTLFILAGKPFIILVFGSDFATSYTPMVILVVGQIMNSSVGSVAYLLNMTGHERETVRGLAAGALSSVGLNLLLVPVWGIRGAAAATASSMIVWNFVLWWEVRKRLRINSTAFSILRVKA
jgi:O-antigen/teichoic acid export membrane protein